MHLFSNTRRALLTPLILVSAFANAYGQATNGNIIGSVLDASGAAVSNASVQSENAATAVKVTTTTDSSGLYRLSNLPVGSYKVTASAAGFTSTAVDGAQVALNVTSTVNITMQVGTVSSTVEVSAAAAIIDTTT